MNTIQRLQSLHSTLEVELESILTFWMDHMVDDKHQGFIGKLDHENKRYEDAPKGVVLNARILWAFSAAFHLTNKPLYLETAKRAYHFLNDFFYDPLNGGYYWTVSSTGIPLDTKKQIYAQAFVLYAFSEFYKITLDNEVLERANALFHLIATKSFDQKQSGYAEAFSANWNLLTDLRLSEKDNNDIKTTNTHLHIIEAYSNLYNVYKHSLLKEQIINLLHDFRNHIIHPTTHHLQLFFDEQWNVTSGLISYGHDIEAAWLLHKAALCVDDAESIRWYSENACAMTEAAAKGLDENDGGLWYEYLPDKNKLIKEKHWWPQAEAMIGFFNHWQISKKPKPLEQCFNSWNFIKNHILDKTGGEWVWGVYEDYTIMYHEDKAGLWKCPYHNSRACIEIIQRIKEVNGNLH